MVGQETSQNSVYTKKEIYLVVYGIIFTIFLCLGGENVAPTTYCIVTGWFMPRISQEICIHGTQYSVKLSM